MHLSCMCAEPYDSYGGVQSGYSIRRHWKRNIVDTFTHHFCAIGHGGVIGTSFTYIREVEYTGVLQTLILTTLYAWHSSPSQLNLLRWDLTSCMLHYMLHNRLWALLPGLIVVTLREQTTLGSSTTPEGALCVALVVWTPRPRRSGNYSNPVLSPWWAVVYGRIGVTADPPITGAVTR